MAYDKVVDSAQLEEGLTSVADAIRAKTGKNDSLKFPVEFSSEIAGISVGDDTLEERLNNTMIEYSNAEITKISEYGFAAQSKLETVSFPEVKYITSYAFYNCNALRNIFVPKLNTVDFNSFRNCYSLTEFITNENFNSRLDSSTFEGCSGLLKVDFYHINNLGIGSYALACQNLVAAIFRNTDFVPTLHTNAFGAASTKMNSGQGYIYVYKSVIDQYKAATNWAKYTDQILAIEDYPEITGG